MNTIPAREIKLRGMSALDEMLRHGPVHIIQNNRPSYVVLTQEQFARLTEARSLWEWNERPVRGTRRKKDIDAQIRAQRDEWS